MGGTESKLVFKRGIFKLSEEKDIPADDSYWTGFWELPESVEDVFSLFSAADIRRIRDESLGNLETLILAVTSRLSALKNNPSFPSPQSAPEKDALNCIRILTRLLPFLYEADHLEVWEEKFFWGTRRRKKRRLVDPQGDVIFDGDSTDDRPLGDVEQYQDAKPLAEELIDTLIDLLFFCNFTIPLPAQSHGSVHLAIWQSGVGCNSPMGSTRECENNRLEILRLLLTLSSKSMYTPANILPVQGVRAVTYITTLSHKQLVLTLLCSLLNTTLKYNPATWHVPYDHVVFKDPRQILVTFCLQLLLVLVLYPVPESPNGIPPKNSFRYFFGKLHRPQDFQFLVEGMTKILNQPLQATTSYLPGSQKSLTWAPEMIMLFWEALQCNKRFRSFIIDTDRSHDFMIYMLFYAFQHKSDATQQGVVRMCVFVLQTLSVESKFGSRLNKPFHAQETLPQSIRLPAFRGSYADFFITSLCNLIMTSKGKLDTIYPALLAVVNNVASHAADLNTSTSSKLMQLFSVMSSPEFLFANESNHELLTSLLEAFNAIIENQYEKNATFVYSIVRSSRKFNALREMIETHAKGELDLQAQKRKKLSDVYSPTESPRRSVSGEVSRSPMDPRLSPLNSAPPTQGTFAIGGDDDDFEDEGEEPKALNSRTSTISESASAMESEPSRAASVSSTVDDAVPQQLRGMSEKARGKLPANHHSFSRNSSTASISGATFVAGMANGNFEPTQQWAESWLTELPLQTALTVIDQLTPRLPTQTPSSTSGPSLAIIRQTRIQGLDPSPLRIHLFEWSPLSLGWYESLLWGFIFSSELSMFKGQAGIWRGTNIKLFRVQEAAAQGPSLTSPRGAVDAVGSNLVQRIGSFNLRTPGLPGQSQRNGTEGTVRDT